MACRKLHEEQEEKGEKEKKEEQEQKEEQDKPAVWGEFVKDSLPASASISQV